MTTCINIPGELLTTIKMELFRTPFAIATVRTICITWDDYRSGTNHDIYIQKVESDGKLPAAP